jgi:lysophospholipase L1-like esterase
VVVVEGGTNNIGNATAMEITAGLKAIVAEVGKQAPEATILLMGVFPRNDRPDAMRTIDAINEELQRSVVGGKVRFLSLRDQLADANGVLREGVATPDRLHLALPGYEAWAKALRPHLLELLGEPAKEDHAPAATGDPSKKK